MWAAFSIRHISEAARPFLPPQTVAHHPATSGAASRSMQSATCTSAARQISSIAARAPYGDSSLSDDFPILNAYQPCLDTPPPTTLSESKPVFASDHAVSDRCFRRQNKSPGAVGLQLLWSTYLGGAVNETGPAVAVDSGAANVYLTGETNSSVFNLPTGIAPFQLCLDTPPVRPSTCSVTSTPTAPAPFDAYVARLSNPTQNGRELRWMWLSTISRIWAEQGTIVARPSPC